jgi:polyisoprenoid-binding protein YceI
MKSEYKLDPTHSSAHFSVRHMMITNVRGGFQSVQGTAVYDPGDLKGSQLAVLIDAATVNTLDAQRDAHLKSADFLDVVTYPSITFTSTKITAAGERELSIAGDLTVRGVTKQVVLTVDGPSSERKDPWGNIRIGASAATTIKRSDFGLVWNAPLETGGILVGDELKIQLEVSLIRS